MSARFVQVTDVGALEDWIARSEHDTVVLFNHDPWCPISNRALKQMENVDDEIVLIDVSRERAITREIAQRTGVRHESPQVIVLQDGEPAWTASHFEISAEAVERALTVTQDQAQTSS